MHNPHIFNSYKPSQWLRGGYRTFKICSIFFFLFLIKYIILDHYDSKVYTN